MDSRQNPVAPQLWVDLDGEEIVYIDLYKPANQKVREPMSHFGGKI